MKTCTLIYNPVSGKKTFEQALPKVEARLSALGYTCNIYKTAYPTHAELLVQEIMNKAKPSLLVIAGGDGTFNECLNGLMMFDDKPDVAYIPSGTSNDLGTSLGISKDLDDALDVIEAYQKVNMDVGVSKHGYFSYVCATGSYIDISYETSSFLKRLLGFFAYIISGVKRFFRLKKMHMSITTMEGKTYKGTYTLMLAINSRRVASLNMINRPILDDGKLDVILYKYTPLLNNVLFFIGFFIKPPKMPRMKRFQSKGIVIEVDDAHHWNQDGEKKGSGNNAIHVVRQALPIIINKKRHKYFKNQD